ncbi:DUF7114 family protein [Halorarius litoreus]|uniref:DUF7114 family protein n=1 Tax=Halorarius litoreus TaxID=2962676 RepID=UPI0020CF99C9|nr:hypothetical protein [Halorarius litoreus]
MDEAAAVRRAALEAVGDVTPPRLRDDIEAFVADGSLLPGVLTLATATAAGADATEYVDRAAGVQLIYDGLRLTRTLAHEDPWTTGDRRSADMDILAADVLVARGFYLLAHTGAATAAVGVVRAFGRDQTDRRDAPDPDRFDRQLETDVLDLAITTGAAGDRPAGVTDIVSELVAAWDGRFPDPEQVVDDAFRERLVAVTGSAGRPLNRND